MKTPKVFYLICLLSLFSISKSISQTEIHCAIPSIDLSGPAQNASSEQVRLWEVRQTISVRFLAGGSLQLRNKIRNAAREWERYANIKFQFVSSGPADIRISFKNGAGSYSFVGTNALWIPETEETMNFDFVSTNDEVYIDGVILHEFGHALGLWHEHQNR